MKLYWIFKIDGKKVGTHKRRITPNVCKKRWQGEFTSWDGIWTQNRKAWINTARLTWLVNFPNSERKGSKSGLGGIWTRSENSSNRYWKTFYTPLSQSACGESLVKRHLFFSLYCCSLSVFLLSTACLFGWLQFHPIFILFYVVLHTIFIDYAISTQETRSNLR